MNLKDDPCLQIEEVPEVAPPASQLEHEQPAVHLPEVPEVPGVLEGRHCQLVGKPTLADPVLGLHSGVPIPKGATKVCRHRSSFILGSLLYPVS